MNEIEKHASKVYQVRNKSVMLDFDLAQFYQVKLNKFNEARKRKQEQFVDIVFQLTSEEWAQIRSQQGLPPRKGNIPWVYTEKAAYKMAFVLESKTSLKVADLILEVFVSVRNGLLVPVRSDKKVDLLERRVDLLEQEMMGQKRLVNNFYAPTTLIQGNHNQVHINSSEELIMNLAKLLTDQQVVKNRELTTLLSQSITLASERNKKGLLEALGMVADVGSKIVGLSSSLPAMIAWVSKLMT
jgi:hypothetical protein